MNSILTQVSYLLAFSEVGSSDDTVNCISVSEFPWNHFGALLDTKNTRIFDITTELSF